MTVRQEENTPIGNYFHDNGILKIFEKIKDQVDEFEVDTEELSTDIDFLISSLKGLKITVKKAETEYTKYVAMKELKGYDL
jgi:hypothetical protein